MEKRGEKMEKEGKGKKRRGRVHAGGDRGRGRPHVASVAHARARGRWGTHGASGQAAPGCARQGKGEREREERFAATITTGGEEKERSTVSRKRVER